MIPGKTYVGILPGHTRPAFVRKPPVDAGRPPLLLSQIFGSSRRSYSVETLRKPNMFCRPRRSSDYYYDYATAKYRPKIYVDQSPGRTITSVQQTCASCGKFRSARWQAQHPLIPGRQITPGLCGRCRDRHTSSDEERPRRRRRRDHRHHRRCVHTDSTDDSPNSSWESRRAARRHRSRSRDYRRRNPVRSPSRERVRITIANQAGDRIRQTREVTRSSSMEPIRVVRRTEVVDLPERPTRTRSVLRGTSHVEYVDSETQYVEDWDPHPPRYPPKPRRSSRVSYIEEIEEQPRHRSRPGSSSYASYVEERPRYRSRSRSVGRVSYIEESALPRSRSRRRARSSSQVRFVDEIDAQASPKLRRLKSRRVVYFDGPADNEKSGERTHSCTSSDQHSVQGAANNDVGPVLIEEVNTPQSLPSQNDVSEDRGARLIEDQFIPDRRTSSQSYEASNSTPDTVSGRKTSETRSYACESDHEATPRPAFRHAQVIQGPDDVEEPSSHRSSYTAFDGVRSNGKFQPPTVELRDPSNQRTFTGAETPPYRERRRRVRDSDVSSASEDDDEDYPRSFPIHNHHVEAPEAPPARRTNTDLLVEMLQKATITPPPTPGAQYDCARGRTPQRSLGFNEPDTPSRSFDPDDGSEDGRARYGYGSWRMTGDSRYGGPSLTYEPECKSNAEEYNWMT